MLGFFLRLTKMDRVRNEQIRGTVKVEMVWTCDQENFIQIDIMRYNGWRFMLLTGRPPRRSIEAVMEQEKMQAPVKTLTVSSQMEVEEEVEKIEKTVVERKKSIFSNLVMQPTQQNWSGRAQDEKQEEEKVEQ